MASAETPEDKELRLVRSVEFKIASASTDKKLEELLDKFLPPLLLKLASDSLAVRNKVGFSKLPPLSSTNFISLHLVSPIHR